MAGQKGYGATIADHIAAIIARRRTEHVLHFTRLENLPHILRQGLRSRADLADVDFSAYPSDADRLDERNDAISVSISCYAPAMFEAKRYRTGNRPWVVLILRQSSCGAIIACFSDRGLRRVPRKMSAAGDMAVMRWKSSSTISRFRPILGRAFVRSLVSCRAGRHIPMPRSRC